AQSVVSRLLFPSGRKMVHSDRFLMPTTSRVDYSFGPDRHFVITSQCTPISEHETEVYTVMTFRFGRHLPVARVAGPLVRLFFEPISRKIIRQDARILQAQTEQLRHYGHPQFTFVESDLIGPHIWRLWRSALDGAADPGAAAPSPDLAVSSAGSEREVLLRF